MKIIMPNDECSSFQPVNAADKSPLRRTTVDNLKLYDGLLAHASRVALLQYALSASFVYLFVTRKWLHSEENYLDLLGYKLSVAWWMVAGTLVYFLVNLHMGRIINQMTRLLKKDKKNAAAMAIMTIQSTWFGNPFYKISLGYLISVGAIPCLFGLLTDERVYGSLENTLAAKIVIGLFNAIFVISGFFYLPNTIERCAEQIRKVVLLNRQPPRLPIISAFEDHIRRRRFRRKSPGAGG